MHISLGKYADLPAVAAETAELKAMLILDALLPCMTAPCLCIWGITKKVFKCTTDNGTGVCWWILSRRQAVINLSQVGRQI